MSSQSIIVQPTSRKNIRYFANLIREIFDLKSEEYFPVVKFLEFGLPEIDKNFHFEIEPITYMGARHGVTYPEKNLIVLREDVYENAIKGKGRDRFTIAHEIGHYFMHRPNTIALGRISDGKNVPKYSDPEWQANTFAGELLAPPHIIKNLSIYDIVERCGVSLEVAGIQSKQMGKY